MKTSELTGPALDWAVAKCESLPLRKDPMGFGGDSPDAGWWVWDGEGQNQLIGHVRVRRHQHDGYSPSTDWAQGGPILEREGIMIQPLPQPEGWCAYKVWGSRGDYTGPTPLIAAMRTFVASKFGDDIEIPEELCT